MPGIGKPFHSLATTVSKFGRINEFDGWSVFMYHLICRQIFRKTFASMSIDKGKTKFTTKCVFETYKLSRPD